MGRIVVLDSGPLGMLCNPAATPLAVRAKVWVEHLAAAGCRIVIPAIADYEVRRELLRIGKAASEAKLDRLGVLFETLDLSRPMMQKAAELWAEARNSGRPTADPKALDGDVILAAQALAPPGEGDEVVVATTNPGHLAQFVPASAWDEIA